MKLLLFIPIIIIGFLLLKLIELSYSEDKLKYTVLSILMILCLSVIAWNV